MLDILLVVGGGLAGSVIAYEITQTDEARTVLILEAGHDVTISDGPLEYLSNWMNGIPIAGPLFQKLPHYDWAHETVAQTNGCGALQHNVSYWPMGKGLGGSQLLNNMIYHRGHADDFKDWFPSHNPYDYDSQIKPFFEWVYKNIFQSMHFDFRAFLY